MSANTDSDKAIKGLSHSRGELINDRLTDLYDIRAKCERARALRGTVPTEHHLAFHNAIRDVYLALRPLSDDATIDNWWDKTAVSNRWGEWEQVDENSENAVLLGQNEDGDPIFAIWQPYEGLDQLDELRDITVEEEQTRVVFGAEVTETETRPNPLDYDVLLDISMTLEDAAEKLGFMPEPGTPDEDDPDVI